VIRTYWYLCSGWRRAISRALLWVALVATVGFSVGGVRHEGHVREQQLCGVVVNVHRAAQFRAQTEHENLKTTLKYLRDPESKTDSPALYRRVQENLPIVKNREREANASVVATRLPPVCREYWPRTP
jgi:hypothetical protein